MSKTTKQPDLSDRIKQIRDEIDAFIDAKVEVIRKETGYLIPPPALRQELVAKSPGCQCSLYLMMTEAD